MGGDHPSTWPKPVCWMFPPPPHHPAYATARRSYCRPKVLSPVLYCTHATSPTQMNRALERISPKPMVDGFVEIFDEFRNGCDEKAIRYRHMYEVCSDPNASGEITSILLSLRRHVFNVIFRHSHPQSARTFRSTPSTAGRCQITHL